MDVLHERCAGVDISKKDAKACVRTPSTKRRGSFTTETTTWGSTTNAVLALRDHLLAAQVTPVVMSAGRTKNTRVRPGNPYLKGAERATRRAITALNQLGYTVTLNPIEDAA